MTEFLAELYIPRTNADAVGQANDRTRRAAAELTAAGTSVRFLHSIFVPADETCLFLFEAGSIDAVRDVARRAALSFEHIAETATDSSGSTGDEQDNASAEASDQRHHDAPSGTGRSGSQTRKEEIMTKTAEAPAAPTPDLAAVKQRQQQAWASGDFHVVASRIVLVAEHLCDTADLQAGWYVLDVATGSGNAAIAAARLGCNAIGVDYVPSLLERGRERATAEGLDVALLEGDAEALPFLDRSFDAVTSVFGSMFAPDHAQAASELLRVSRPGGTIALASWTPDGFIGELFRTVAAHVPPPAGVPSPMLWGTREHLARLFGDGISSLEVSEREFTFRFRSAEEFVEFFRTWYGPTLKAFAALDSRDARRALEHDLVALARRFDRLGSGDAIAIPSAYTEAIAIKRRRPAMYVRKLAVSSMARRRRRHRRRHAGGGAGREAAADRGGNDAGQRP